MSLGSLFGLTLTALLGFAFFTVYTTRWRSF
jgi:hypothetical protein